jgi:glycosyltransferase involved in cell wall biosynthesis
MQKPVVASAAGGMYEIIEDGRTGRLYPPGDASLLAQRIHDLLRDPKAAAMLAKAGQAHALKRFSLENHLNTLDRVIEDVVQQISRVGWSGKV